MAQRQYEPATVFNARIADLRHLWVPSDQYKGQKTTKPNYFAMFLVKKTQATWYAEPALAGVAQACGRIYQNNPHILQWPVVDGDMPSPEGKSSEFAKGHWLFSGSSGNPPNVEIVQAGGALVKLTNKVGVKSGDYVMCGVTAAVKQNDPRGVKLYLNAVVFSSPGEEIVFASSVSGAELMQQAARQGLQVAGFAPGGGFAPQQGGFPPPNYDTRHPGIGGGPASGPAGAPGFTPGGFAPPPGPAQAGFGAATAAPGQFQPPGPGFAGTISPSNPAPGQFTPPAWPQQR
jgi:hypothetical protein